MASFYNRYYRYYNPYFRNRVSSYHEPDKKHISSDCHEKIDDSSCSEKDMDSSCSNKRGNSFGGFSFGPISFKNFVFGDLESPIFDVFGIQLYLDDIIILGLLFFLYQEGVQDEMLYIALILLLIG